MAFSGSGATQDQMHAEPRGDGALVELLQRARARGWLPVIVELAVPGMATPQEINHVRMELLAALGSPAGALDPPAATGIMNVKPFATIPFVGMTVTASALQRLVAAPQVAAIVEDGTANALTYRTKGHRNVAD